MHLSCLLPCFGLNHLALCRGPLAAAADSLGRVLLFDCSSVTILRIWKAYRHVQIGWMPGSMQVKQHTQAVPSKALWRLLLQCHCSSATHWNQLALLSKLAFRLPNPNEGFSLKLLSDQWFGVGQSA